MKHVVGYDNHGQMDVWRSRRAIGLILIAIVTFGCAGAIAISRTAHAQPSEQSESAQQRAASNSAGFAARQAFVEGYTAWLAHDYLHAIDRLGYAANNFPELGDYALFYLASSKREAGDLAGAATTFERMRAEYPQSVKKSEGELALARVMLKLGRASDASALATHLAVREGDTAIGQNARLVEAQSLDATGRPREAYADAMAIRDRFPHGAADSGARELAYSILGANPSVADRSSLEYRKGEAELLIREGQATLALAEAARAIAMRPETKIRAEMLWVEARASSADLARRKRAILEYLRIAPRGPAAPSALYSLALVYWRENDLSRARASFAKVASGFPSSVHATAAMMRIGRIFEEMGNYGGARVEYVRLYQRYPSGESAENARFRAAWSWYMTAHYAKAAATFAAMRPHVRGDAFRDMFDYWRARSLERGGDKLSARAIYARLARSTASNYYPALAARRVTVSQPEVPAAHEPDPSIFPIPTNVPPSARFHLSRVLALRAIGVKDLQAGELRALEGESASDPSLREFVLAGFQTSGAWYDAIVAATKMEKRGHLSASTAERIRYPRAYWELFEDESRKRSLDPWLVLALARQESLFNPHATSVSDARGLMQLIPSTARRVASEDGSPSRADELYDPAINVELGTAYLKSLFAMFDGDEFKAVAAYNGGEHAVEGWTRKFPGEDDEWVENIGYSETCDYVKKVIGGRREYLLLYGK